MFCRNHKGSTARHIVPNDASIDAHRMLYILHAVGAKRCSEDVVGCSTGCAHNESFNGSAPPVPPLGCTRDALDQMLFSYSMDIASSRMSGRFVSPKVAFHFLYLVINF